MAEHNLEGGGLPMARLLMPWRNRHDAGFLSLRCILLVLFVGVSVGLYAEAEADTGAGPWVSSRLNPPELATGEMTSLEILYGVEPEGDLVIERDSIPWYLRLEGSGLSSLYYHDEAGVRRRGALVRLLFKVLAKETRVLDTMRLRIGDVSLETPRILLGIQQDGQSAQPTLSWLPGSLPLVEGEETFLLLLSDNILPDAVRQALSGGTIAFEELELPRDALFIRESLESTSLASPWSPLARYRLVPLKSGRFELSAFSVDLPSFGRVRVEALKLDVLPAVPVNSTSSDTPLRAHEERPVGKADRFVATGATGNDAISHGPTAHGALGPFPEKPVVAALLHKEMESLYAQALHYYGEGDIASCLVVLRRAERSSVLWRQARFLRWQLERDQLIGPWAKEAAAPLLPLLALALCGFLGLSFSIVFIRFRVTKRPGRLLVIGVLGSLVMAGSLLWLGFVHLGARGFLGSGQTALSKGLSLRALPDEELEAEGRVPCGQALRVRARAAGWVLVETGDRRAWAREDGIIRY